MEVIQIMKRWIIGICLFFILSISCTVYGYGADYDRDNALEYVNTIRYNLGIGPLENNQKLEQSATFHSKYMAINDSFSPIEENGNKYYRGRYSWDRASYFYYGEPYIMEFIHDNLESIYKGTVDFINNPYSRVTFLDPLYQHIGIGSHKEMYTYDLGGESRNIDGEKILAIYPYDGMEDIAISWKNNYKINPYRELEDNYEPAGLPITVTYYSNNHKIKTMKVSNMSLTNTRTKKQVQAKVILPQDDKYLTNTLIILPLEPYDYETTYELDMEVAYTFRSSNKVIDQDDQIELTFVTEKRDMPLTRGDFVEQLVKDLDYEIQTSKKTYKDIDKQSEEAPYIYTAYERNLVKGYSDNTFRPELRVTREQVYVVLMRALEMRMGSDKIKPSTKYQASKASSWAQDYIKKAYTVGLLKIDETINYNGYMMQHEYEKLISDFLKIYHQYGAIPRFMF